VHGIWLALVSAGSQLAGSQRRRKLKEEEHLSCLGVASWLASEMGS